MVRIDLNGTKGFAPAEDKARAKAAMDTLLHGTGAGNDFLGWIDLPVNYDKEEFARIQQAAKKIQSDSEAVVVIGIGGSYLGARAVVELLKSPNYNGLAKKTPDIYFAGNGISGEALSETIAMVGDRICTDVQMAHNAGAMGVLVLSGETTLDVADKADPQPHITADSIEVLGELIREAHE